MGLTCRPDGWVSVEFRILGTLDVVDRDDSVVPGGLRPRSLLAALLLHPNEVLSADRLADAVWRGEPPPSAVNSLHTYVTRLRQVLEPDRPRGKAGRVLVSYPTGYAIRVGTDRLDALRFEVLADDGRAAVGAGDPRVGAELLAEALGLWRGPALPEFAAEPFAQGRLAQLEERRLVVIEDLVASRLELGKHDELAGELEHLVAEHPLRERLCELRMLALYRAGRQADALRACRALHDRLRDELGITPSRAVVDLEHAILVQSPALDWHRPVAATDSPTTAAPVVDDQNGRHAHAHPRTGPDPGAWRAGRPRRLADDDTGTEGVPTGTVTFLFTDIEDSTRLWEDHPEPMQAAVERHDSIVKSAIEGHGGYVFSTAGDAFAAAFERAEEAVAAAVEAQQVLGSEVWPAGCALRVRMGLHVGEAQERGGGYFGPALNRAARIMTVAHGGQILVSNAVAELVGERMPLRDLGEHRLRDLRSVTRVWQAVAPGLEDEFPTLRTSTRLVRTCLSSERHWWGATTTYTPSPPCWRRHASSPSPVSAASARPDWRCTPPPKPSRAFPAACGWPRSATSMPPSRWEMSCWALSGGAAKRNGRRWRRWPSSPPPGGCWSSWTTASTCWERPPSAPRPSSPGGRAWCWRPAGSRWRWPGSGSSRCRRWRTTRR
jgi:class 3 adenylate cyclase/DNA-binding SARP family transcriptional activator